MKGAGEREIKPLVQASLARCSNLMDPQASPYRVTNSGLQGSSKDLLIFLLLRIGVSDAYIKENLGFPCGSDGKESTCNAGDPGSILGLGRSPEEGNGNLFQYYCLGNPMDRGAWKATVLGIEKELDTT